MDLHEPASIQAEYHIQICYDREQHGWRGKGSERKLRSDDHNYDLPGGFRKGRS